MCVNCMCRDQCSVLQKKKKMLLREKNLVWSDRLYSPFVSFLQLIKQYFERNMFANSALKNLYHRHENM